MTSRVRTRISTSRPPPEVNISTITLSGDLAFDFIEEKLITKTIKKGDHFTSGTQLYLNVSTIPSTATEDIIWTVDDFGTKMVSVNQDPHKSHALIVVADRKFDCYYNAPVTITATSKSGNATASFDFYIENRPVPLERVTLSSHVIRISDNEDFSSYLTFNYYPEEAALFLDSSDITWSANSDDLDIYTEDVECWIYGGKPGKYQIILDVAGKRDVCNVEVVSSAVKVTGIAANQTSVTVNEGYRFSVTALALPENATNNGLIWDIGDESIINVYSRTNNVCEFKAMSMGKTELTIRTVDGNYEARIAVTVEGPAAPDGFMDIGYRMSNGEPVFFSQNLFYGSDGIIPYFAWADPEPYFVNGFWREGKTKGYIAENYKWYGGKTGGTWWTYKVINYRGEENWYAGMVDEDDPVQKYWGFKFHIINPYELDWMLSADEYDYDSIVGGKFKARYGDKWYSFPILPTMRGKEETHYSTIFTSCAYNGCVFSLNRNEYPEVIYHYTFTVCPWFGNPVLPVWRGYYMI